MARCNICEKEFKTKEALEMHNKSKHPEKTKNRLNIRQKRKIRNYIMVALIIGVALLFFYWKLVPSEDAPIIKLNHERIDLGPVSQLKGTVSDELVVTNIGKSNLVINNMDTSCGCTSASLTYEGKESPRFSMSMHGTNPSDFSLTIPPGREAKLNIYYDPNVHPDLRGAITRSVYLLSNDPRNPKKEVRISAVQID